MGSTVLFKGIFEFNGFVFKDLFEVKENLEKI